MSEPAHIHDCTGPDLTCACGFRVHIERYAVSFDVFDNQTQRYVVNDSFMTDQRIAVGAALRRAADTVDGELFDLAVRGTQEGR